MKGFQENRNIGACAQWDQVTAIYFLMRIGQRLIKNHQEIKIIL